MKTVKDIKIILHKPGENKNPMVAKFKDSNNAIVYIYNDENELLEYLHEIQGKGYKSKEVIVFKEYRGRLFQKCPGSPNVICCNYYLINTCFDCLYNCSYCFLNSYLNSFGMTQFTNISTVVSEIKALPADNVYRIGTGEFTDSLMFDEITGVATSLIKSLASLSHIILEFKTKSSNIDHLLDISKKGNTVLAWSLNTKKNIGDAEEDTADLYERLEAAKKAVQAGYYLAFHFDPIIIYNGFLEDYYEVIDLLFSTIPHNKIMWISMGGFRYAPGFKEIVRQKFPNEQLTTGEFFPGEDGKYRYLKPQRIEIYKMFREKILSYTNYPYVYLCMESHSVWKKVFNTDFSSNDDLEAAFLAHIEKKFNIQTNF